MRPFHIQKPFTNDHSTLNGQSLPLYGNGENVGIGYTSPIIEALLTVLETEASAKYIINGNDEHRNIDIVTSIVTIFLYPQAASPTSKIVRGTTGVMPLTPPRYETSSAGDPGIL